LFGGHRSGFGALGAMSGCAKAASDDLTNFMARDNFELINAKPYTY
jgi:hypothetical protein